MSARPRVVCIVQARMGSSRLPGKVLARAGGRSLLEHLVARLRRARTLDDVVVATTVAPADDALAVDAGRLGVGTFRGSEDDVLSRYAGAAARAGADVIVRVTADCPLLDSDEVDRVVGEFLSLRGGPDEVDYATNQAGVVRRIPRGLDVEVFTREALSRAQAEATEPSDREHVTPYLYRVAGRFRTRITHFPPGDFSAFRLTVDAPEDLELVRRLFVAVGDDATFADVARYLGKHPELLELNRHVGQKGIASEHELRRQRVAGKLLLGRADAGPALGLGHVARTFALLEAWVECGGRAELVGAGVSGRLRERMNGVVTLLDDAPSAGALAELGVSEGAVAIALDGYQFGAEDEALLRRHLPLLVWDDEAKRLPDADIVLNQNLGVPPDAYAEGSARALVGAAYLTLRRELREAIALPPVAPADARRVLVAFGGSDPAGLSARVASALCQRLGPSHEVAVVLGAATGAEVRAELAALAARNPGLTLLSDPASMADELRRSRALVLGAGSLAWEALALGLPSVLVAVAENQKVVVRGAVRAGAAVDGGVADPECPARVAEEVARLLADPGRQAELGARARRAFDGRGCFRVIDALLDVIERRKA